LRPSVMNLVLPRVLLVCLATAAILAATAHGALRPRVSAAPRRSWQVVAPDWTQANKEAGRVDDILRVGGRVFIGGNFTELADHHGRQASRTYLAVVRPGGSLGGFRPHL